MASATSGLVASAASQDCEPSFLTKYRLLYLSNENLLVCSECKCVLGVSYARHVKNHHHITISTQDSERIKALCFTSQSQYVTLRQPLLKPLDFLPVYDGFRCVTCNFYGKDRKYIAAHSVKKHGIEHVIPCKVQTLSTKTCFITYFGVADTPTQLSILAATSIPISQIVKETTMDVFHVASAPDLITSTRGTCFT